MNAFNHPWTYQVSYVFPHVTDRTCHKSIHTLILVAPCCMEAPRLPTVLNTLEDIPNCSHIKGLIKDVLTD